MDVHLDAVALTCRQVLTDLGNFIGRPEVQTHAVDSMYDHASVHAAGYRWDELDEQ